MEQGIQPVVIGTIAAAILMVATKLLEKAIGRAREHLDERAALRTDLEHQIKRRQEAEKEAEHAYEVIKELRTQLEDAENGSRLGLDVVRRFRGWQSENELERERWRGDCKRLQDENAQLRRRLRENGISVTDALSRRDE